MIVRARPRRPVTVPLLVAHPDGIAHLPIVFALSGQFLQGIAFDLWTSTDEFRAWLQRADDLQRSRKEAILAWRQPVPSRLTPLTMASTFPPLYPIPNLSSSQRPSSSGSASFYPSLDPLALPPLPLIHPASVSQRQGPQPQPQRVPQMSMAQLQVGSSNMYPHPSDSTFTAGQPSSRVVLPTPYPPQQQQPIQSYPAMTIPSLAPLLQVQPPASVPSYTIHPMPQQLASSSRPSTSQHRQHASASSSSSLQLPRPHSSSQAVQTPRSAKRPAGEAFSSPPLASSYEVGPAVKRQQRGSFDSSAVSTPSGPYPLGGLQHPQVPPMTREVMGAFGPGAGGSAAGSSAGGGAGARGEMGLGAGFGTMVGGGGVLSGRRGPVQWPSMQEWTSAPDALYGPVVFQERDQNGDIKVSPASLAASPLCWLDRADDLLSLFAPLQLYVQTLAASPLVDSPSYPTYRKAVVQVQPAPPYAQPRNPSNLGQASSSCVYPEPYPYPQPSYTFPPASQLAATKSLAHQRENQLANSRILEAQERIMGVRPPPQPVAQGNTSPPELDWRTGRLEKWRRGVVSTPVSEEE